MDGIKFIKLINIVIILLSVSLYNRPSVGMEEETELAGFTISPLTSFSSVINALADVTDSLHGVDLYKLPAQKSDSEVFLMIPDELHFMVLCYLYRNREDINNLCAVAGTCKGGYRLMQDTYFWNVLKPVYFGHLPEEYLTVLLQGKRDGGLKLCSLVFDELLTYQEEEIKRLISLLKRQRSNDWPDSEFILINQINMKKRRTWANKLTSLKQAQEVLIALEKQDNLEKRKSVPYRRYEVQESVLNYVNTKIVRESFRLTQIRTESNKNVVSIGLKFSLTRLPSGALWCIRNFCERNMIDEVTELDLSYNHLRWVSKELFFFQRFKKVNFCNNFLRYLPNTLSNCKDHLIVLEIGNYAPLNSLLTNRHNRRTSGNEFRKVPPILLELKKLEYLDLSSVQLGEFSQDQVYTSCPKLRHVCLVHNNLEIVPKEGMKNEADLRIFVDGYGNPGSEPIPKVHCIGDFCYDMVVNLASCIFSESTLRAMVMSLP